MAGPYRIVPHDRAFRIYKGEELLGTEMYLKGAKRIVEEFQALAPGVDVEPYQRPRSHLEKEQTRRAGRWGLVSNR